MNDFVLKQGDCLDLMKDIPDNSIDLIVTDPPYKIVSGGMRIEKAKNDCSGIFNRRLGVSNKWIKKGSDDVPAAVRKGKMFKHNDVLFSDWLPDIFRVLKPGSHCYIMINSRNLKELQTEAEKVGFKFVNLLAWRKNNKTPNKYYMQQMEFILLLRKGKAKSINDMGTSNCIDVPNIIGKKAHPTEKPVELMRIFIENSSEKGETVFDPFMGCGSTGIAAINTGRRFIGFELDEGFFETATKRLADTFEQKELEVDALH